MRSFLFYSSASHPPPRRAQTRTMPRSLHLARSNSAGPVGSFPPARDPGAGDATRLASAAGGHHVHDRTSHRASIGLPRPDVIEAQRRLARGHHAVAESSEPAGADPIRVVGREDRTADELQAGGTLAARSPCIAGARVTGKVEGDDLADPDLEPTGRVRMKHVHTIRRGTSGAGRSAADDEERRTEQGGGGKTAERAMRHAGKDRGVRRRIGVDHERHPRPRSGTVSDRGRKSTSQDASARPPHVPSASPIDDDRGLHPRGSRETQVGQTDRRWPSRMRATIVSTYPLPGGATP